jgi:hypothetical protein
VENLFFKKNPLQDLLFSLDAVISILEDWTYRLIDLQPEQGVASVHKLSNERQF